MKKSTIFIIIFAYLSVVFLCLINIVFDVINVIDVKEENKIYIVPTKDYKDAHYTDIVIESKDDKLDNNIIAVEIIDISPELLKGNLKLKLCKKNKNNGTYYEIQSNDTKYVSVTSPANIIYFFNIGANAENNEYRLYFWKEEDKNRNGKDLYINYKIKTKNVNNEEKKDLNTEKCNDLTMAPSLNKGLIPVNISDKGDVRTIQSNSDWYNYCEKKWANAVLVTEETRDKYLNKKNIEIDKNDILAYFVWIPRYSYKLWTTDFSKDKFGEEQEIEIKFVDIATKEIGNKVNEWHTHPAFTFGNNELSGLWVGKFEITGKIDLPTILPNEAPITNYNLNDYFESSLLFSGGILENNEITYKGSNKYGLSNNTKSHLIKNSEWGAIVYLSNSKYGINDNIRINNYFNETNMTGCGALESNIESTENCNIMYGNSTTYPQSSTGNITGIFDLSGGTGEYVMAYFDGKSNLSGINNTFFLNKENGKYYDFYSSSIFNKSFLDNVSQCDIKTCAGHALYETHNWYMTVHNFVDTNYNFIKRGCGNFSGAAATQYCLGYATGEKGGGTSSRVVLTSEL